MKQALWPFILSGLLVCGACTAKAPDDEISWRASGWLRAALTLVHAAMQGEPDDGAVIVLNHDHPVVRLPLTPEALQGMLEIRIRRIENAAQTPFTIFVYLEGQRAPTDGLRRVYTGSFTPFPANQPGAFQLSLSAALEELGIPAEAAPHLALALVLDLRPVFELNPRSPITVEIVPPAFSAP